MRTNSVAINATVVVKTFSDANSSSPSSWAAKTYVETAVGPSMTIAAANVSPPTASSEKTIQASTGMQTILSATTEPVAPAGDLVDAFDETADDAVRYAETTVCWADDEDEAIDTVRELWPQEALPSSLLWDIPTPVHFDQATSQVTREDIGELVSCGPDPDDHIEAIQKYVDAGYEMLSIH